MAAQSEEPTCWKSAAVTANTIIIILLILGVIFLLQSDDAELYHPASRGYGGDDNDAMGFIVLVDVIGCFVLIVAILGACASLRGFLFPAIVFYVLGIVGSVIMLNAIGVVLYGLALWPNAMLVKALGDQRRQQEHGVAMVPIPTNSINEEQDIGGVV